MTRYFLEDGFEFITDRKGLVVRTRRPAQRAYTDEKFYQIYVVGSVPNERRENLENRDFSQPPIKGEHLVVDNKHAGLFSLPTKIDFIQTLPLQAFGKREITREDQIRFNEKADDIGFAVGFASGFLTPAAIAAYFLTTDKTEPPPLLIPSLFTGFVTVPLFSRIARDISLMYCYLNNKLYWRRK